jgi:hypothetical protein
MFDIAAYAILSTIVIVLSFTLVIDIAKASRLRSKIEHLELEKQALRDELSKIIIEQQSDKNDGFIKFLSQSREWAFSYIEEVQSALKKFDEIASPNLQYARTYGKAAGDTHSTVILDKIDNAYSELIKVLPKDS